MYDPSIGRWLEMDPIGFQGGDSNLYRYTENDPENNTDPSGLVIHRDEVAGQVHLYYRTSAYGIWDSYQVYIGTIDLATGLVRRDNVYAPLAAVEREGGALVGNSPNWTQWFQNNGVEPNLALIQEQGVAWRQEVGQDFRNEAIQAQDVIHVLAQLNIEITASAGMIVGGSRFVPLRGGGWYNATARRAATPGELASVQQAGQSVARVAQTLTRINVVINTTRAERARLAAQIAQNPNQAASLNALLRRYDQILRQMENEQRALRNILNGYGI